MQERTVATIVEGSDERQENLGGWGQQDQSPPMEAPAWPNYEPFSFYFEWQYGLQTVYLPGVDGVNRTDQRRKTLTEMFFAQLVAIVEPCQKSCVRAGALKITPTFYITPSPLPLGPRLKARTGHESPHQPTQYDNAQVKQMKKILDEQLHHWFFAGITLASLKARGLTSRGFYVLKPFHQTSSKKLLAFSASAIDSVAAVATTTADLPPTPWNHRMRCLRQPWSFPLKPPDS